MSAFGNLSVRITADISDYTTNLDIVSKKAAEGMRNASTSVDAFNQNLIDSKQISADASRQISNNLAAANDAIAKSADQASESIANISEVAKTTDMRPLGERIAEAIGTGIGVGIVAANKAWDGFVEYSKTKALVIGAVVSAAFAAVGLGAVYAAYKVLDHSMDFIVGLITGSSYKNANIDALVEANNQVKAIQQSLSQTAQQAAITNEALASLGVNKDDYVAVFQHAQDAIRSNKEQLDELGLKYGSVSELIQSANDKLNEYTEGWDRNQAAMQMGLGTAAQVAEAAKLNGQAFADAKQRLNEYNLGLGTDAQASVKRYEDTLREFNHNMDLTGQGFKRVISDSIMPMLTDLADFFKDGWPTAVNLFRIGLATITSLLYGLKEVAYIVSESILGSISAACQLIGGVGAATAEALKGNFTNAKEEILKSWEGAKTRFGEIWGNIVAQSESNAKAMKQAWALDDRNEAGKTPAQGKQFVDPEVAKQQAAQTDAYNKLANAIREKTSAQKLEIELGDKLTEGQRKAIEFTSQLQAGTLKLTEAQKAEYTELLNGLIQQEKINKQQEAARREAQKTKVSDYQQLMQTVSASISQAESQLQATGKLTEAEKLRAKFLSDLRNKVVDLTDNERKNYLQRLQALETLEKSKRSQDEVLKVYESWRQEQENAITAAEREAETNKKLAETYGMTRGEVAKLELADVERQLNMKAELALTIDQIKALERLAAARRESAAALEIVDAKDQAKEAAKKAEEAAKVYETAYQASNKKIGDGLYSALATSGESAGKKLLKDIKEWFARLVLQPVIAPISAFGASLINPNAPSAQGNLGGQLGGAGGLMNFFSAGTSLFNGFSSALNINGLGNGFWGSVMGGFNGAGVGSGLTSQIGLNIGSSIATGLKYAMPIVQSLGMLYMANSIGKSISGGMSIGGIGSNALVNIGTLLGGIPGAIGAGLINRAFGMGDKQITGANVTGTIGTNDLYRNVAWHQDGGFFRGDRNGTWSYNLANSTAIADGVAYQDAASKESDTALLKLLNDGYSQLKTSTAEYAKALGINADSIKSRTDQINFATGKDAAETQQNMQKMFADLGDKMAADLLGPFAALTKNGETAGATLTRLAVETKTVDAAIAALGLTFSKGGFDENLKKFFILDDVGQARAKSKVIDASGGVDAFNAHAQFFAANFLSKSEQMKPVIDGVAKSMSDMGYANITTNEQFKKLVQSIDLSSDAGANLFAKLQAIAPAFKTVADYNDALKASLESTNASIQQEIDSLKFSMLSESEQQAQQLKGVDASTAALLQNKFALQAQKKALDDASAAAQRLADTNASIQQQIDSLRDARLNEEQRRQKQIDAAADQSTKDKLRELFAEQDIDAAKKKADEALAAAAQAAAQASQQAAQSAQQLAQAWQSANDAILNEVDRIRGVAASNSSNSYAVLQSQFAITTAQARANDLDAAKKLPQLSQALLQAAEQNAASLSDLNRIRAMVAYSLEQTAKGGGNGYVPSFDAGTSYVPKNVIASTQAGEKNVSADSNDASNGDVINELKALRETVKLLLDVNRDTARSSKQGAEILDQVTAGGTYMIMKGG